MQPQFNQLPPQAIDFEESVLASMILDEQGRECALSCLRGSDFYRTGHQMIFSAIGSLSDKRKPVDLNTIYEELKTKGQHEQCGGAVYLAKLVDESPIASSVEHYAEVIKGKAIKRRLISEISAISQRCFDNSLDAVDLLDEAQRVIMSIQPENLAGGPVAVGEMSFERISHYEKIMNQKNPITGIRTGLSRVDFETSGLQPTDLIIIAGRPGMGKTALLLDFILNAGIENIPSAVVSLEMSAKQLFNRLVSKISRVNSKKFKSGGFTPQEFQRVKDAIMTVDDLPVFIDDSPDSDLYRMIRRVKKLKKDKGIQLLGIDYLQLMSVDKSQNKNLEISEITRKLKLLAKELHIPVVLLSQLNRSLEQRQNRRPVMSDLRDSGCLGGGTLILSQNQKALVTIKSLDAVEKEDIMSLKNNKGGIVTMKKGFKTGVKQLYDIELITGHKIKATANHKFLEYENTWKRVDEITTESLLAIPLGLDVEGGLGRNLYEAKFIAMMLANGCSGDRRSTQYTSNSNDSDLCDEIMIAANKITNNQLRPFKKETICEKRGTRWINVFMPSIKVPSRKYHNPINEYLKEIGIYGKRAFNKEIPGFIFFESVEFKREFLKYLFSTDGSIGVSSASKAKVDISYTSKSEKLIFGVQFLLQSVGILSRVRLVNQGAFFWYSLSIHSLYFQKKYIEDIGFAGVRKGNICKEAASYLKSISPGWTQYILNDKKTIAYVKVKSISKSSIEDVYDIEVPGTHNFIANGIIVHNSIEQDADIIFAVYRDEIYNENTVDKGIAELLTLKFRDGEAPAKTKLKFTAECARFETLANNK